MRIIIATLMFSLSTWAADTATTTAPTEAPAPTTPKQVCEAIAKAAVEDNFTAFTELTTMPAMMHDCNKKDCKGKSCPMGKHKEKKCAGKNCPLHKGDKDHKPCKSGEEGFHKMHAKELEKLKDLNCKEEKVVGDHAWVEAESQKETRLVPFKMIDGKWKFDMHTYHSFYRPQMDK